MTRKKFLILSGSLGWWLAFASWTLAAIPLDNLTVGYASFSGHYTPMWIAVEDGLGRKYGIDPSAAKLQLNKKG
jgi:hypothetical protein